MRHLHSADLGFLSAFHDTAVGRSATVNAMAVLSRADEIGAGRIDALLSARTIAERYRTDGALRSLALDVVPIAGPRRAVGAHAAAARVRGAPRGRPARSQRAGAAAGLGRPVRPGGCRRSTCPPTRAATCSTASACSASGCRRSRSAPAATTRPTSPTSSTGGAAWTTCCGLVSDQFRSRADALKARTALAAISALVERRPTPNSPELAGAIERLEANAHELRELSLLSAARTTGSGCPPPRPPRPSG